jgi:hypothetical protein
LHHLFIRSVSIFVLRDAASPLSFRPFIVNEIGEEDAGIVTVEAAARILAVAASTFIGRAKPVLRFRHENISVWFRSEDLPDFLEGVPHSALDEGAGNVEPTLSVACEWRVQTVRAGRARFGEYRSLDA